MTKSNCGNCDYWQPEPAIFPQNGLCRRFPTQCNKRRDEWCGEHKQDPQGPAQILKDQAPQEDNEQPAHHFIYIVECDVLTMNVVTHQYVSVTDANAIRTIKRLNGLVGFNLMTGRQVITGVGFSEREAVHEAGRMLADFRASTHNPQHHLWNDYILSDTRPGQPQDDGYDHNF